MKTIWRKINEFSGKIKSRRSSTNRTTRATSTHHATVDEFYIGVTSEKPITVYLPTAVPDGKIITVKAEMKPPMAGRKITIATIDGSTIDGYDDATITVSHDYKSFIYHNKNWHIIS